MQKILLSKISRYNGFDVCISRKVSCFYLVGTDADGSFIHVCATFTLGEREIWRFARPWKCQRRRKVCSSMKLFFFGTDNLCSLRGYLTKYDCSSGMRRG